jgi:acyl-coenzyme A synthetase/AMP-(fatty) acid ligase
MLTKTILLIVPKYVFFLSHSDSFPKTASGKVQKFKLKETALKILKEQSNAN